ncbi:MAG TPA: DUF2336 domain-containing protein [Pseudolabrys sp.]|nr:DUF2336 domain-containing protein [Pseudolabrys sp.]
MSMLSYHLQEIESAIQSGSGERRLKALMRITDLFVAESPRYSPEQIQLFDDLLEPLAAAIEVEARAKLARYVAPKPNAPAALARNLAFDDAIAVAGPVLAESTALDEEDLIANASSKSQEHLLAIAQRPVLSEPVTDVLIERGERRVVHTVAQNPGARISDNGFSTLVARAADDDTLAQHVGTRDDIPRQHFLKLLDTATASVRAKLEAANPRAASAVQDAVIEAADEINLAARNNSLDHLQAKARFKRLTEWNELSERAVHSSARAQNFEQTAVALSALASFSIDMTERALLDRSADLVLLICKAAGCSWTTAKAVLTMKVAERGLSEMALAHERANFARLQTKTAKRVLEFYEQRRKLRVIHNLPGDAVGDLPLQAQQA